MKTAKKDFTNERISMAKTGGGPPIPEMSATSQGIVGMMSSFASFSGIPDASNCESMIAGTPIVLTHVLLKKMLHVLVGRNVFFSHLIGVQKLVSLLYSK